MTDLGHADARTGNVVRFASFGHLQIAWDERVLRPRPWTSEQSEWAASLLPSLPPGDVLELCSGAGHIGLLAVARTERRLVCVDASPVACDFARRNAETSGLADRVQVRCDDMESALSPDERFALVVADPPWVASRDVARFPEDPSSAIDGGLDGLDLARACLRIIAAHLAPEGAAVLQLGPGDQADRVRDEASALGLEIIEIRRYQDQGVLVRLHNRPRVSCG